MSKNKIDLSNITEKQKLTISQGLLSYVYIMSHKDIADEDFRDVFTDFFLSSQGRMRRENNRNAFFGIMDSCPPDKKIIDIVKELYSALDVNMYEFSFATKLLHTVNDLSPIYDSKVRKYLKECEDVDFHLYYRTIKTDEEKISAIEHDWNILNNWYSVFFKTERCHDWINWFDENFPDYEDISNIKKVDFIIFACN